MIINICKNYDHSWFIISMISLFTNWWANPAGILACMWKKFSHLGPIAISSTLTCTGWTKNGFLSSTIHVKWMVKEFSNFSYEERHSKCDLFSMSHSRLHEDVILAHELYHQKTNLIQMNFFKLPPLTMSTVEYDILNWPSFFFIGVVTFWNCLPAALHEVATIPVFIIKLDSHWLTVFPNWSRCVEVM